MWRLYTPGVTLLHLDAHLAIVDKPSGLLSHKGSAGDPEAAVGLARRLTGKFVFPVHRLDRGASGCLVFALSAEIARPLHEMFESGAVDKRYLAVVRGAPAGQEGTIDHEIPRREGGPRVPAATDWRLLATGRLDGAAYSLLEARPRSGRLHQIRRHLKHLGHPIVGDVNYGKGEHNRRFRDLGIPRLLLHAASVRFVHPATQECLETHAPLPSDFRAALAAIGVAEKI